MATNAKVSHLSGGTIETKEISRTTEVISGTVAQRRQEIQLKIANKLGIHARPASKLVNIASKFLSAITIQNWR